MDEASIINRINSFDRWHYQFDLAGHKTPIFQTDHINRHAQRKDYFFRPIVSLLGGSLAGKRILDLGCNAGYWSLFAVESGCDYVMGIDGRQKHVDQAEFVFDVKGIDRSRYSFHCGDIFDLLNPGLGKFDIVLFLGLMYHISKPISLLERISALNTDLLVIDTLLSEKEGSVLEIRHESLDEPRNAIDHELVLLPTGTAVSEMAHQFGYRTAELRADFTDYTGADDYRQGKRRAFICSKQTDLSLLKAGATSCEESASRMHSEEVNAVKANPGAVDLMDIPAKELTRALLGKVARRLARTAWR
jgi:tRNA (mo5U34)-methyltransferase